MFDEMILQDVIQINQPLRTTSSNAEANHPCHARRNSTTDPSNRQARLVSLLSSEIDAHDRLPT